MAGARAERPGGPLTFYGIVVQPPKHLQQTPPMAQPGSRRSAKRTVAEKLLRLSLADQELFAKVLLAPPKPTPALRRAFARRRRLVR
jgi:hypothetical protein